ncbi:hypothetical protein BH11PLA1_BH11PLA1_05650 [soil metagenome]
MLHLSTTAPTTLAFLPNISPMEWLIILAVLLLLFGRRLPEVGKSLGKGIVEFKKGIKGVEDEISTGMNAPAQPAQPVTHWQQQQQQLPANPYAAPLPPPHAAQPQSAPQYQNNQGQWQPQQPAPYAADPTGAPNPYPPQAAQHQQYGQPNSQPYGAPNVNQTNSPYGSPAGGGYPQQGYPMGGPAPSR